MKRSIIKQYLPAVFSFFLIYLIWKTAAVNMHPLILPGPEKTFQALREIWRTGELLSNISITLKRTMIGYGSSVVAGILFALLLNKSSLINRALRPLITVIQATPPVVWVALAVTWFGIADDLTPIFLIFVVSLPVIFINIYQGLSGLDSELLEMAILYQSSEWKIVKDIYLPALLPAFVSALSIGFAFAWKASVFAEFIGSSSGVGFALSMANNNLQTAKLFAWTIILIIFMLLVEYVFLAWLQKRVGRWKDE